MRVRWVRRAGGLIAVAAVAAAVAACTPPAVVLGNRSDAAAPAGPACDSTLAGTPLPRDADGTPMVLPTPQSLIERCVPTVDELAPPAAGRYASTIASVPADVLARSTWSRRCPVGVESLRYLTMSFWGFDQRPHTGEMIVNAAAAKSITEVFHQLFDARFPLERMRVTSVAELDAVPTGDGNTTSAFVCRAARGQTRWSAHAYGLAVDINPFCNPYSKGGLVLPELASAYLDRGKVRPGMILAGDATVKAFAAIGWSWGGSWSSPVDRQHFSADDQ